MIIAGATIGAVSFGIQVYNSWRNEKNAKAIQASQEAYQRAAMEQNFQVAMEQFRAMSEARKQIIGEEHQERTALMQEMHQQNLRTIAELSSLDKWPLAVMPLVMRDDNLFGNMTDGTEKFDFIVIGLVTAAVVLIGLKIYTPELWYCYYNSDAGLHLKEATEIVRSQQVTKMYLLHLQNAMFIEMIQPFVRIADWYKGYILGDCFFLWAEILFFAALIRQTARTKASKVLSLILIFFYFMGYPFLSFYYSFGYWAMGSMFVGFLALTMRLYEEALVERKITVVMLMLGCFGVMTSYMMFAPVAFITVFVYLIIVARREGKVFSKRNVLLAFKVFLLPTVLGLYYCLYGFFISSGTSISGALSNQGGIYTELYMDFFWTIFPVLFVLAYTLKKRKLTPDVVFFCAFFGFTGAMLLLTLTHHTSTYYFYKTYYPLWMFCWALTARAVSIMLQEAKETLIAYCAMIIAFAGLCFGKKCMICGTRDIRRE